MLLFLPLPTAGAAPRLEASLSPQELRQGERAVMTVEILWPQEEGAYSFIFPTLTLQNLVLVRQGESQETTSLQGVIMEKKTFTLEFAARDAGPSSVGSFGVSYTDAAGQPAGSLQVLEHKILVRKKEKPIPLIPVAAATICFASAAMAVGFMRLRAKRIPRIQPEESLSAAEQAIRRIREIADRQDQGAPDQRAGEMGGQLKSFVASHYGLQSSRAAEGEIFRYLESKQVDSLEIQTLRTLFEKLHEVRYSGARLTDRDLRDFSEEIVRYLSGKRIAGKIPS